MNEWTNTQKESGLCKLLWWLRGVVREQDSIILSTGLPPWSSPWGLRWLLELHPSRLLHVVGEMRRKGKGSGRAAFTPSSSREVLKSLTTFLLKSYWSELTFTVRCSHKKAGRYGLAGWQYTQLKVGVLLLRKKICIGIGGPQAFSSTRRKHQHWHLQCWATSSLI